MTLVSLMKLQTGHSPAAALITDLLIDMLKLTEDVKRLNSGLERIQDHVMEVDKRVVRLETMVEMAMSDKPKRIK